MTRILVVDDEPAIVRAVAIALEAHGHQVDVASGGQQAVAKASATHHDAIILDLGLPDLDGLEVIRRVRAIEHAVPIIVLSAWDDIATRVEALDLGADDFVPKPFGMPELLARVRVALRHATPQAAIGEPPPTVRDFGRLHVDADRREVRVDGELVDLTRTQFDLLWLLCSHPGRVLTHRYISDEVWGRGELVDPQNLRVVVSQVRKRIERDPGEPRLIRTELGIGYRFEPEADA